MGADNEQLSVTLEARVADFERNFRKASKTADDEWSKVERRGTDASRRLRTTMEDAGLAAEVLKGALGGLFAGLSVDTAIQKVIEFNQELAKIGDTAKRVGMSTDQFQSLSFAGQKLGRMDEKTVASGATALTDKAAKEYRDGEGELTKLLEANNLKLTDRAGKLKSANDLLADAARLIQNAGSETDKVDIARLFGLTDDWVRMLEQGPQRLKAAQAEATATGKIFDTELIQKALEFDSWWQKSWSNFAQNAKAAAVEAASYLRKVSAGAGLTNDPLGLERYLEDLKAKREATTSDFKRANYDAFISDVEKRLKDSVADAKSEAKKTLGELMKAPDKPSGVVPYDPKGPFGALAGVDARAAPGGKRTILPTKDDREDRGSKKLDAFDREERGMAKRIRNLGAESEAIGKSTYEGAKAEAQFRLLDAAKEAGLKITPELTAKVNELSSAYAAAATKLAEARLAQNQMQELQGFIGNSIMDFAKGATNGLDGLVRAVQRLADSLVDAALKAMILGQGPLAGLFGTGTTSNGGIGGLVGWLFGGLKFADGGFVAGPGTSRSDSIPARLSHGEFVVNAAATAKHLDLLRAINGGRVPRFADGGLVTPVAVPAFKSTPIGASSITVAPTVNATVHATGGTPEQNQDLAQRTSRQIEGLIRTTVVDEITRQMRPGNVLSSRYG